MQQELVDLIGKEKVSVTKDDLATHAIDKWNFAAAPEVVVFAESTEDISQVLAFAHEKGCLLYTSDAADE